MNTRTLLMAGLAAAALGSVAHGSTAPGESAAQVPEGQRYETLRSLARHLDETAQGALEGALDEARHGTSSEPTFLATIRSFAESTRDFRATVDEQHTSASELTGQVNRLGAAAHELSERIRSIEGLVHLRAEWEAVVDVTGRIEELLAGGDVEVPVAFVVAPLSGERLTEFRQLAHDLDASAALAYRKAERDVENYPARGGQFLGELKYFAAQSRSLHRLADASPVDPQEIGPVVDHVLNEAREADRQMRDARVFLSVWDDSGRTITLLERMARLARS